MGRFGAFAAVTLVLTGLIALVGCIWIPGDYKTPDGEPRPETLIGPAESGRPLRLLEATRQDVELVLGKPPFEDAASRRAVYEYKVKSGVWLTICFGPLPIHDTRYLRLQFTEDGRLRDATVFKSADDAMAP